MQVRCLMRKLIIVYAIFSFTICNGQNENIDSLKAALNNTEGALRVSLLHDLVKSLWTIEPEEAMVYAREAIIISAELENLKLQSISYRLLGGVFNYMSVIDSGNYYKLKALKLALELNDSLLVASSYNNLGVTAQTVGNYIEALEYFFRSYLIGINLDGFAGLPIVISNISEVYYDLQEYDSAIKYSKKAIQLTEKEPIKSSYLLAKIGLARANQAKGNHSEAKSLYLSIIELGKKIGDKRYTAYAYHGLGKHGINTNDRELAKMYFKKALNIFTELDDLAYIAEVYMDLGKFHFVHSPDSAIWYTKKSLTIATELNLNDLLIQNHRNLSEYFYSTGDIDSLFYHNQQYNELKLLKKKVTNTQSIEGMLFKIQDEQNKIALGEQSLKLQKQTLQTAFFTLIAIVTFFFAAITLYYFLKQRRLGVFLAKANQQMRLRALQINQKNKDLEALNNEKNDLINIVAHDLRNPLSNILGTYHLLDFDSLSKEQKRFLEIIEISTHHMLAMINKILDVDTIERGLGEVENIPVDLSNIVEQVAREFENPAQHKQIQIHLKVEQNVIVLGDSTHIHQVVENLVSNAVKYSPYEKNIYINLV